MNQIKELDQTISGSSHALYQVNQHPSYCYFKLKKVRKSAQGQPGSAGKLQEAPGSAPHGNPGIGFGSRVANVYIQ